MKEFLIKSNDDQTSIESPIVKDQNSFLDFNKVRFELLTNTRIDPYEDSDDIEENGRNYSELDNRFDQIWKSFCNYLENNFQHCVSLNHLGRVLQYVKRKSTTRIKRNKPSYLESNVPNLIVCPKDEIIKYVLSIYAFTADQEMPNGDEVLYCNSQTSLEDIELFWMRVMSTDDSEEEKIYSIVNVQVIIYHYFN